MSTKAKLPLEGIRVIDITQIWAGPRATKLMADMGAQVIKVEATTRYDPFRGFIDNPNTASGGKVDLATRSFNQADYFHQLHRNQLGITLDLLSPQGVAVFKKLVEVSDVVIDNFRMGALSAMGLDYETLKAHRSDIIVISMPGFGEGGPYASCVAYGVTVEGLTGLYGLTGYEGGGPLKSGANVPDPLNALHGAGGVLAALWYRRRTGKGQFIDFSHYESLASLLGDCFMEYALNGRVPPRAGNRHTWKAPSGCYRCRGEDNWIAISVSSDEEWTQLCQVMPRPDLADDPRFSDALSRWKNQDELNQILASWTAPLDHYELMHRLQAAGVTAAPVAEMSEVFQDPHLRERKYFDTVVRPGVNRSHLTPALLWKLSKTPGQLRFPAPRLGEHNNLVLGEILGLSGEEIGDLEKAGIIGDVPAPGADANAFAL